MQQFVQMVDESDQYLEDQDVRPGAAVPTAKPCQELQDAWALIDNDVSNDVFIEKLKVLLPVVEGDLLELSWRKWFFELDFEPVFQLGKSTLKQFVYSPFSLLFVGAVKGEPPLHANCWGGDVEISSSIPYLCKSKEDKHHSQPRRLTIKPDLVLTLADGWDPFAMVLVHYVYPYDEYACIADKDEPYFINNDKSPLITTVTARLVSECINKEQYGEIALPFMVITGKLGSLYVTTLDEHGTPHIQVVGYPDGGSASNIDLSKAPSDARKKFLLAFLVILNKFRIFFEANCREQYDERLQNSLRNKRMNDLPTFDLSGNDPEVNELDGSLEKAAQEAAACGGQFSNVTYPFERPYLMLKTGHGYFRQHTSPYYFTGSPTSKAVGVPTTVFLKVWKKEDRSFDIVESERMHHKRAFDAGIPVAAPVLDKIVRSKSSCGADHYVFATEYLDEDSVETVLDALQYSVSLLDTVLRLHNEVGMLHCSLKPANVRWNKGMIKLIDFEMAQDICDAEWHPGPPEFLAPEVLKSMTIQATLECLTTRQASNESHVFKVLGDIAAKLTDTDPQSRWSLEQARGHIEQSIKRLPRTK